MSLESSSLLKGSGCDIDLAKVYQLKAFLHLLVTNYTIYDKDINQSLKKISSSPNSCQTYHLPHTG